MKNALLISILVAVVIVDTNAQGCSDAGICTIPAFLGPGTNEIEQDQFILGSSIGIGELSVVALDPYLGYKLVLKNYSLDTKITYGIRSGNGNTINDFGDIFIINNLGLTQALAMSAGVKFPVEFNKQRGYQSDYPMAYQPSLGTIDILAGLTYRISKYHLALAMQVPVSTLHENHFVTDTKHEIWSEFPTTRKFKRKSDLFVRISRSFSVNNKLSVSPGLQGIYHLSDDEFQLVELADYESIEGSAGLTINASLLFDLKVNETGSLSLNLGFPLLVRNSRPDGLTRSFVIGVDYAFSF